MGTIHLNTVTLTSTQSLLLSIQAANGMNDYLIHSSSSSMCVCVCVSNQVYSNLQMVHTEALRSH